MELLRRLREKLSEVNKTFCCYLDVDNVVCLCRTTKWFEKVRFWLELDFNVEMANYGNEQNYWDTASQNQNQQQQQDFEFEMPDQFGQQLWEIHFPCAWKFI